MLPLLGVPMIEWNIRHFRQYGVTDFYINLHYLSEVLRNYLETGAGWMFKFTIILSRSCWARMGTTLAQALVLAQKADVNPETLLDIMATPR